MRLRRSCLYITISGLLPSCGSLLHIFPEP